MAPVSRKVPPACNRELRRILFLGTSAKKYQKKGRVKGIYADRPKALAEDAIEGAGITVPGAPLGTPPCRIGSKQERTYETGNACTGHRR